MYSIRKHLILLAACLSVMVGCSYRHNSPPVVNVDPVPPDEAMVKRDWPQVTATYPNGAVAAGPTNFNYEPKRNMPEWKYAFADSGTFFVNMVLLPYNLIKDPPTKVVVAPGETVGPTYTAQPVMPPPGMVQPNSYPVIENPGTEPATPPVVEPAPAAPSSEAPAMAPATPPAPETAPAPAPAPAPTEPAQVAPPAPAPQMTPDSNNSPGVAPRTPRVIEPPPPQATKNLAPPMPRAPATGPSLNKD
jgi:hypothetical protein